MAHPPKTIAVKDSASALQAATRTAAPLRVRLQILLLLRQPLPMGMQALASALGVNPTPFRPGALVTPPAVWKDCCKTSGVALVIDAVADRAIVAKLSDPLNAPRSFKELQQWVSDHHVKDINYHTLNKHVKKKHGQKSR